MPKIWVSVCYEKVQQFCHSCGRLGHDLCSCRNERLMSEVREGTLRYNADMGTSPLRAVNRILLVEDGEVKVTLDSDSGRTQRSGVARDMRRVGSVSEETPVMDNASTSNVLERDIPAETPQGTVVLMASEERMDEDPLGLGHSSMRVDMAEGLSESYAFEGFDGGVAGMDLGHGGIRTTNDLISEVGSCVNLETSSSRPNEVGQAQYYVEFLNNDENLNNCRALVGKDLSVYETDLAQSMKKVCLKRGLATMILFCLLRECERRSFATLGQWI